jgi:hypothetical protein
MRRSMEAKEFGTTPGARVEREIKTAMWRRG